MIHNQLTVAEICGTIDCELCIRFREFSSKFDLFMLIMKVELGFDDVFFALIR